jgi:two-component system chemotaxis response regulator CheB
VDNLEASTVKKALVVDDSAFMRKLISDFLNSHSYIEVIGTARNGKDAVEKVKMLKPDVVTLDVEMPLMNGLDALKEIMNTNPVPVVMLSSTTKSGAENTILAMEFGAVDFIAKPGGAISLNLHDVKQDIISKVYAASHVPVSKLTRSIGRTPIQHSFSSEKIINANKIIEKPIYSSKQVKDVLDNSKDIFSKTGKRFVIIGTSTGGPRALQEVLTQLPATIDAPILIVQHMPAGFTKSLADRLNKLSAITVKEAEDGEKIVNGTAYIAPGGMHLKMRKIGSSYFINLDGEEPSRNGHRPSVDVLLESAALQLDINYVAVIMTGMGYDGRDGMERLKKNDRTISIAESAKTSVVYGMPKAIVDSKLADKIVDVQQIPETILEILQY